MSPLQRRAAVATALGGFVVAVMYATDMAPNLVMVIPALVATAVVLGVVVELARLATQRPAGPVAAVSSSTPRVDARIRSLRFNLRSMRDVRAERLYQLLVDLIDDQLVSAHGVDRRAEPERARALLGSELQAFVDDPGKARVLKRLPRLERIVTEIERL